MVGAGAKSLQTQEIFEKLVKDTIIQDDDTVSISNMRTAIKNTNVVLNMAISPGVILISSSMLILKEKLAGYNNVLTMATKKMKFGFNRKLNYNPQTQTSPSHAAPLKQPTIQRQDDIKSTPSVKNNINNELGSIFGSMLVVGMVVVKYIFF